jgi:carbonic anhydrase
MKKKKCDESVNWIILKEKVEVYEEKIEELRIMR